MKVTKTLLPLVAAMLIAGCGNRGTAQNVVGQADGALSKVREAAVVSAPEELKAAEATLAHMKQSFDSRDYEVVVADVPKFNEQLKTLEDAVATGQSAAAAATQEWTTLNAEVPKTVAEIQARVDTLKPNALPNDVTRAELETAKTELAAMKVTWAEATAAATAGNPVEATDKARIVQAKAQDLKNALGMNQTLASAG